MERLLKICLLVPILMSTFTLTLLSGGACKRSNSQGLKLLSNPEICDVLEMGKGWLYRRHKSEEISGQRRGAIKDCAPGVEKEGGFSTEMNRGQQMYLSYRLGGP